MSKHHPSYGLEDAAGELKRMLQSVTLTPKGGRSEQGIRELDNKYGKICHNLPYNIVSSRQAAEECVNDAYSGAWNGSSTLF